MSDDKAARPMVGAERRGPVGIVTIDRPERRYFERLFDTEDQKDGMRAFLEKRKLVYRGR